MIQYLFISPEFYHSFNTPLIRRDQSDPILNDKSIFKDLEPIYESGEFNFSKCFVNFRGAPSFLYMDSTNSSKLIRGYSTPFAYKLLITSNCNFRRELQAIQDVHPTLNIDYFGLWNQTFWQPQRQILYQRHNIPGP